ncbi:hypothetical protein LLB_1406 [Legionella longbeachae D-4968]|nr:hypothetical protein LLB_1406 [Legionella longbeachae D-4968]
MDLITKNNQKDKISTFSNIKNNQSDLGATSQLSMNMEKSRI